MAKKVRYDRHMAVYFNCFGIEYIPREVLRKIKDKSMTHNIFRIQDDDSFYRIDFIEYMFAGKILLDYNKISTLKTNFRLKSIDEKKNIFWKK